MTRKIGILLVMVSLITLAIIPMLSCAPGMSGGPSPWQPPPHPVVAIVPDWSGFVPDADKWNFGTILVTSSTEILEARFVRARIEDQSTASLEKVEWTEVARVGRQMDEQLAEYERLHRLVVEQHARLDELEKYEIVRWELYQVLAGLAEGKGVPVVISSMRIDLGETEVVELVFEVRRKINPAEIWQITAPTSVSNLALPPEGIPEPEPEPRGVFESRWHARLVEKESWPQIVVIITEVVFEDHYDFIDVDARFITPVSPLLEGRFLGTQIGDQFVVDWNEDIWHVGRVIDALPQLVLDGLQVQEMQAHRILEELAELGEMQETLGPFRAGTMVPSGRINPGETLDVELVFEVRKADDPGETLRLTVPTRLTRVEGRS
ncbi:MAG: hypothetical protein DDT30_02084 [Dehalococcoidia bacterium]|nr:hypothetical protein [Bacillota bacterium]